VRMPDCVAALRFTEHTAHAVARSRTKYHRCPRSSLRSCACRFSRIAASMRVRPTCSRIGVTISVQTMKGDPLCHVRIQLISHHANRLEHLGDSVVGLLTTEMILERFPGLRCGPATVCSAAAYMMSAHSCPHLQKIKSLCVGNPTLAAMCVFKPVGSSNSLTSFCSAVRYHLPDRLRVHPAQMLILRASANVQGQSACLWNHPFR